jgi:enamine deaminase RidA (YjgF/YER057c/UK114 family)
MVYNVVTIPNASSFEDNIVTIDRRHVGKRLSDMVIHNGTIYLAGQVADDRSADIAVQAQQVLANIDRLLAEGGSDKRCLLSATIYLADMANYAAMNAVWDSWIPAGETPARATVQASLAHADYKIEIQAIAAVR